MSKAGESNISASQKGIWVLLFVIEYLAFFGFSLFSIGMLAGLFLLLGALSAIETRTIGPRRRYWRLALLSSALIGLLGPMLIFSGGDLVLAAFAWTGLTVLGLVWVAHYNRTEPAN